jgi:serine/threonine-protein kinase
VVGFDPGILEEIRSRVSEALGRFGVAGVVRVEGDRVTLVGHGATVGVQLGPWVAQWDALAPETRTRRCSEIARDLARRRRASQAPLTTTRRFALPDWVSPLAILLAAAGVVFGAWRFYPLLLATGETAAQPRTTSSASLDAYERERRERAARVCDATRSRVLRGAAVGPADVEGWVVELSMLRPRAVPAGSALADLAGFFEARPDGSAHRLVWSGAPDLAAKSGPDTVVAIEDASLPNARTPRWGGLRIVFSGRYVPSFFHQRQRVEFMRLANGLTNAFGAEYAALYARCAHRDSHHMGAWFRGPSPGGAVAALLYWFGTYADVPHVQRSELAAAGDGTIDRVFALARLANATAALDKRRVSTMLGPYGGMIAGEDEKPSTITFPFRDANRADRASRGIARELGFGIER